MPVSYLSLVLSLTILLVENDRFVDFWNSDIIHRMTDSSHRVERLPFPFNLQYLQYRIHKLIR
jgi:hypothetical protein